jgi:trimethylamine--corrinoid protein Co-methyltransferase
VNAQRKEAVGDGDTGADAAAGAGPRRQSLAPLRSDFAVRFHDEAQMEPLRDATLRLLATTGMRFESPKALAILKNAGAAVDEGSDLVRLPRQLVEETLALAPREFTLGARDPSCDLQVGSGSTYGTTDGCGVQVVDWRTGERRSSTKADLEAITRMQDCLGSISFWWPTVSAGDCGETAQLHEIEAGWNNTTKHLMGMVQGETLARAAVEMATAVAGGPEELRRRPVMSDLIGTVSPLLHDRDGIEAGLVFAEAGIPVCYVTMPNLGTTAPATKAGAFVIGAAEIVAAAVLHELAAPGSPVIGSVMQIYADPRTAGTMTSPLDDRCRFLATELLHSLGLPALGAFGGTDAETPGSWLAGVETMLQLLQVPLDGCELFTGIGLTDTYQLFTPENLILDDDLYHRARHAFLDIPMDDESLALGVIDAVGPGGHFLAQPHTRRAMRSAVVRAVSQEISDDGQHYRDPVEVARERAFDILDHYAPEGLAGDVQGELRRVVAAADAAAKG